MAKLFPSCARRLQKSRRAPHGGEQGTGLLWLPSRNRPAQVHSPSTARWRFCHPVFSQFDGLIGWRRLKRVLPSGLFFADFTKNFRRHCRSCWVYASRERHGRHSCQNEKHNYTLYAHHEFVLPHALALHNFRDPERHNTRINQQQNYRDLSLGFSYSILHRIGRYTIPDNFRSYHTIPKG